MTTWFALYLVAGFVTGACFAWWGGGDEDIAAAAGVLCLMGLWPLILLFGLFLWMAQYARERRAWRKWEKIEARREAERAAREGIRLNPRI